MHRSMTFATLLVCLIVSTSQAHFIWVDVKPSANNTPQAQLYFAEQAEPGEPHLIGKIAHAKAWVRDEQGKTTAIAVQKPAEGAKAALTADCPQATVGSVEAFCDYGVYSHGGPGFLIQYYGKHLPDDWTKKDAKLTRSDQLAFDVVPTFADGKLTLDILYQGKPAADKEVVVIDAARKQHDLKTNSEGRASIDLAPAGPYAVRAGLIEADKSGERDGKKFTQTWHYCTLTFSVPGAATAKAKSDPDAAAALTRARASRAVWKNFPGFSADITVSDGGKEVRTKASVDGNGTVTLDLPKSPTADWLERQLSSLVQHRMPDGEVTEGAITWAEADATHPLGRKIDLGDPSLKSAYRLKDDVIMEVNRTMGPAIRFTISVFEIERNAEGKYLPRSFTMNFFDTKTGEIKTSLGFLNLWQRVGDYDLPKKILEITAKDGVSTTRQIGFNNCQLLSAK